MGRIYILSVFYLYSISNMGYLMGAIVKQGTGRATCRVCGEKITKEQIAVELWGYQFSQQIHSEPKECWSR